MITAKNTNKLVLSLFTILLVLILLPSVLAQETSHTFEINQYTGGTNGVDVNTIGGTHDFEIQRYDVSYDFFTGAGNSNPNVCACSSIIDRIYLQNTGSFGADYTLSTNLPEYVTLPIQRVHLEPTESVNIDLLIKAECGVDTQREYNIVVKSNLGREKTITRQLAINKCQTINANLYVDKEIIQPCQTATYEIELTNPAPFIETYGIMPISPEFGFDNQSFELVLGPNKKGKVEFEYTPACSLYGTSDISFLINSANNDFQAVLNHQLEIARNYTFEVQTPTQKTMCVNENKYVPVIIKNTGAVKNTYDLKLNGYPLFVSLEKTQIELEAGEETTVNMIVLPQAKDKRYYNFTLIVTSELGDIEVKQDILMNVESCYSLSVEIQGDKPLKLCEGENTVPVKIINNGESEEEIELYLYDEAFASELEKDSITLDAGEEKFVDITLFESNMSKSYSIFVTAKIGNKDIREEWKDEQKIELLNYQDCVQPTYEYVKLNARYEQSNVAIKVKNIGVKKTDYIIDYDGSDFIKPVERKINLDSNEQGFINLELYANDAEYAPNETQYFTLTLIGDVDGADVEYVQQFELQMSGEPFYETWYNYCTQDTCKTISGILIVLIVLALIFMILMLVRKNKKYNWIVSGVLIFVVILIIVIGVIELGLPIQDKPALDEEKINDNLYIIWYEDSNANMDLSEYFSDPDNDSLTYSINSEPENIGVELNGKYVTLIPQKDWFGKDEIKFEATDSQGASAVSKRIRLEVVDVEEMDLAKFHDIFCPQSNIILLAILLVILAIVPYSKKKGNKDNKEPKKLPEPVIKTIPAKEPTKTVTKKTPVKKKVAKKKTSKKSSSKKR